MKSADILRRAGRNLRQAKARTILTSLAIGVGLAYLVTLLNPAITGALNLESGTRLLQLEWLPCAILIAGLMLVAVVSGWFPSRKAAKLDPIEALRTE